MLAMLPICAMGQLAMVTRDKEHARRRLLDAKWVVQQYRDQLSSRHSWSVRAAVDGDRLDFSAKVMK